ncbi:MAG: hypothetical protein CNE92_07105 [SAR116 cluster bacterium MED-G05]|jgi:hypothetical protein|nr:hypothetical protein [Rhodospirillaceae bacterium]PDH61950.1 MAG: hypothetical protein CNE92_07105 [SAR116 cluster bacterium MED-G05]HBD51817.1 hypothetical protein [Alphaproteobacteria bacterium]HBP59625.1 hypothetical protein [Alphaproteobacteria bacterium]HCD22089.1 hypothetical protein [Alphaproteobacteria bacterium]|tara:strand:+ start:86 stop:430 length:345 start_codon:yes stop_codon:yes gene_type:complete
MFLMFGRLKVATFQDWFDAMAAKDIDAAMAIVHEDMLMVQNEQLINRDDLREGWLRSMAGDDWIMSDWNIKYMDEHSAAVDFKSIEDGVLLQLRMTVLLKDGLLYRAIVFAEPV